MVRWFGKLLIAGYLSYYYLYIISSSAVYPDGTEIIRPTSRLWKYRRYLGFKVSKVLLTRRLCGARGPRGAECFGLKWEYVKSHLE